jgi:hypothetical protein
MRYLRKWLRSARGVIKSKVMFVISLLRVTHSITPAYVDAGLIFDKARGFLLRATI